MLPRQDPARNDSGHDIGAAIPAGTPATGVHTLRPTDQDVWALAAPYLKHRDNDVHTIYAYGIARALCDEIPEADPDVVLPAVILHDTGWSTVPLDQILEALLPGVRRTPESLAVVRRHEVEGARIAREVLESLSFPAATVDVIAEMIDGHDTRLVSLSLDDSVLKDADKVWRVTPQGVEVVMDWFGITRDEAHRLNASRTHDALFTPQARTMARVLSAIAWVDSSPQRVALG